MAQPGTVASRRLDTLTPSVRENIKVGTVYRIIRLVDGSQVHRDNIYFLQ
jgi:hypothetical protein